MSACACSSDHIHALANQQRAFAEHVFPSPECVNLFAELLNPFTPPHSRDRRAAYSRLEGAESDRGARERDRRNGFSRSATMMNLIAESIHPIGRRILPIRERVNVVYLVA